MVVYPDAMGAPMSLGIASAVSVARLICAVCADTRTYDTGGKGHEPS